jgi:hypothetical protein
MVQSQIKSIIIKFHRPAIGIPVVIDFSFTDLTFHLDGKKMFSIRNKKEKLVINNSWWFTF